MNFCQEELKWTEENLRRKKPVPHLLPLLYTDSMMNYDRLIKECFWDQDTSEKDIRQILEGDELRLKNQLFEKILLNSTRYLLDLHLFDRPELKALLESYKVPAFNHEYAFRRKNIAEVFFFDKELEIEELKWTA